MVHVDLQGVEGDCTHCHPVASMYCLSLRIIILVNVCANKIFLLKIPCLHVCRNIIVKFHGVNIVASMLMYFPMWAEK